MSNFHLLSKEMSTSATLREDGNPLFNFAAAYPAEAEECGKRDRRLFRSGSKKQPVPLLICMHGLMREDRVKPAQYSTRRGPLLPVDTAAILAIV